MGNLRIPFEVMASDADETTLPSLSPQQVVTELALRKAEAVRCKLGEGHSGKVIVGSDTVVSRDGQILGKPQDEAEAAAMIRLLQGREHTVYTGVACLEAGSGRSLVEWRSTKVKMKELTESQILSYARSGEGMDKAGAYAIQGLGATLVTGIDGDYFNVVGLPLSLLSDMLSQFGIHVLR